jgi:hypothetical protein
MAASLRTYLDQAWVNHLRAELRRKPAAHIVLRDFLRDVAVDRAQHHLYRGEALQARLGTLMGNYQLWKDSFYREHGHIPSESEALGFMAEELAAMERENP